MRFLLSFMLLTLAGNLAAAAEISWGSPQDITGQLSDFDTEGVAFLQWNAGNDTVTIDPEGVNLTFEPGPILSQGVVGNIDPINRGGDNNYETMLGSMTWAKEISSLLLPGLTPGHRYRVQIWMADTRSGTQHRQKTYDSGAGSSQVVLNSGPPSQYVIGTFTADATTQTLRLVGGSGADHPQYNALALRTLGAPRPQVVDFHATANTLTTPTAINITAGTLVNLSWNLLDADSAQIDQGVGSIAFSGNTQVAPTATITYTLSATNSYGTSTHAITIYVGATELYPKVNEVVTKNNSGLQDEDGDYEDWIELFNPNPFVIGIGGLALTDDPTFTSRWILPSNTSIPANGFLILFASGKNRTGPELHTDFKLSSSGDYIALRDLSTEAIIMQWPTDYPNTLTFPAIPEDRSYGYDTLGELRFFTSPTPGAANSGGVIGFVDDTQFSHKRGYYENSFQLSISTLTVGASIRYTTDGTLPTSTNGLLYSAPISISQTTVIRAIASLTDYESSNVDTQTYLFASDIVASPVMDPSITQDATYGPQMIQSLKAIPVLSLSIEDPETVDNSSEHLTSVELIFADGTKGFQVDAGISHFGGYFTDFAKKNFRLYFRKQYGPGKLNFPLFDGFENGLKGGIAPVEKFDSLDLRSGSHDMAMRGAYLSNRFTDDTMLEMGNLSPHGRFVHVMINGVYWGQYHLRERWNAAMASEYVGGDKEDYEAINGNDNRGGWAPGVAYNGDGSGWQTIKDLAAAGTPWNSLESRVNLQNYIDFILLYDFGSSENEYRSVLEPVENGLKLLTYLNDADGYLNPTPIAQNNDAGGPGHIFGALEAEAHPDFITLLADRIYQHYYHDGALAPRSNIDRLQRRVTETQLSFLSESARWGYRTPSSWQSYQDNLINNQFPSQTSSRLTDLKAAGYYPSVDAPEFNQNGGVVSPGFGVHIMNSSGGVVYYTTDGTDPRLPGGAVNPMAVSTSGNPSSITQLVASASTWKYLDNGSNQGTAWKESNFTDATWATGNAQLGYGDGDESTTVSFGGDTNNKHITTYFRKSFDVPDTSSVLGLSLNLLRDDGAVVYLNGQEILRSNMPSGTITSNTLASSAIGGASERAFTQFTISPSLLVTGTNVFAVEIH